MEINNTDNNRSICPFLGLRYDKTTSLAYESASNCCYHCRRPVSPTFDHQREYCLTQNHTACRVFLQNETDVFPAALQGRNPGHHRLSTPVRVSLWVFVILALLGLGYYYFVVRGVEIPALATGPTLVPTVDMTRPVETELAAGLIPVTGNAVDEPTATPAFTLTIRPTSTVTLPPATASPMVYQTITLAAIGRRVTDPAAQPSPTPGKTETPSDAYITLEKPFIIDGQEFVLHRVIEGEGYDFLALKFNTTRAILVDLNYDLSYPLWIGSVIIIAPGMTEKVPGMPAFRIHQVTDEEAAAGRLSTAGTVDNKLLEQYNNCPADCHFNRGDWVLIPFTD
ncbi:hypothetical protein [Leptolinea tardivitalis]|uniref:hypothetical protein n=1 Tax=Leptolinea tardivitalis TaxID=229920 RepID=UPI00078412D3|nr:hypothetical protein [Leptolinea tardivitalis]GAP23065.1 hypothetical protein LTAR_03310 [Leptolinea tardivitalis]